MPWVSPSTLTTGTLVTASMWNELVNNLLFLKEVSYTPFTANVSITATSEGAANTVVTMPGALTFEAVPHLAEFYAVRIAAGVANLRVALFDGSTSLGLLNSVDAGTQQNGTMPHRFTPTAASHTYSVRAWNASAATSTVLAGTGGTGVTFLPSFLRITRVPT